MFLTNKYSLWYFNIIDNAIKENRIKLAKSNLEYIYYESHHIIPKSMGGTDIVLLTAREHFICHWCLTKMCCIKRDRSKMLRAFSMMTLKNKHQTKRSYTSLQYILARKARADAMILNNPMHNPTTRQIVAQKNRKSYDEKYDKETSTRLKREQSERMSGVNHPLYGNQHPNAGKKIHTEEFKLRLRAPKLRVVCPHCNKVGGKPVMSRYHFDLCKLAPHKNLGTP